MSRGPDSSQTTSFLSVSRKRQALWNVLQPGDPYDIRKSMIAKVPNDKKGFMGDHLQIVCLFQAAQIERLCQFLDDFKLRYRQIERRQLDRHSYEVQIKQLTHKLAQQSGFRQQNQKLRQFIKNQSSTKQGVQDSIKSKYQKLLLQIKGFQDENLKLKRENQQLTSSYDAKFQALQKSKQTQIDEIYMKFSQQSSMSSQFQLNSLRGQYQSQIQRLDLQNKRVKQSNQDVTREIQNWQQKYRILQQQLLRTSPKNDVVKYQKQIAQYENRFVIFGQQIDRLNLVIKQITHKFQISEQRNKDYETRFDQLNKEYILLQTKSSGNGQNQQLLNRISFLETQNSKLKESSRYLQQADLKFRQFEDEINRLTNQLKIQVQNGTRLKGQIQRYQYDLSKYRILQKQVNESKQLANENNLLKMKIAEDQNRIAVLKQQIQRLRQDITRKSGDDTRLRSLMEDNQKLQWQITEWQRKSKIVTQEYESRISQKVTEYESRIQNLSRAKGAEFETRAAMLQSELQRLGELLKRKNQQTDNYQRQVRELEYTITNKYQLDTNRRIQNYESAVQALKRENEEFLRKIRELEPLQRRVNEYQNKTMITSQQVDRLNQQLRSRDNDIQNLKRQIREQEIAIVQKFQMDTSRKLGTYETNLNNLNRQNSDLKRKYQEIQNKAALLSQQIQRLTNNLRQSQTHSNQLQQEVLRLQRLQKQTQVNITNKYQFEVNQKITNYETVIRSNQRQVQQLRRRIIELQNSNRKLVEYENKLQMMIQQMQRLGQALKQKHQENVNLDTNYRNLIRQFQQLGRKYNQLQNTVRNKYQIQVTRTITTLQQNITTYKRQNDELKKYLQEYEGRIKGQIGDIQGLTLNLRNLSQQNDALKRQLKELQNSYRSKLQVEVVGKYQSYESNIVQIRRQLENNVRQNNELKRILQNAEQTNIRLNQQSEQLRKRSQQDFGQANKRIGEYDIRVKQLISQNEGLRRKAVELQTVIRQKYEIQASRRISTLDQNLTNLSRENEELKKRLQLTTRQLQEIRRVAQNMDRDNQQLARRLREFGDINKKAIQYQNKISLLAQQIQRTNINLKAKVQDLLKADKYIKDLTRELENAQRNMNQSQTSIQQFEVEVKTRITQYEQNITVLTQQNNELKRRLSILDDMNRKISQYQNKIVILNQELQRVNQNLRNQVEKTHQLENALRNATNQNQDLKRKLIDLQNNITQKYQVQTTKIIRNLEINLDGLQKQNSQLKSILQEFEQKNNLLSNDLQKLANNLRALTEQNNLLKNQLRQTEISITRKYETEVTSKYSAYERDITNVKRQNQELIRKLRQLSQRVVPQYQNQIAILKQQIQRLNQHMRHQSGQMTGNLRTLGQQNEALKRQILQIQQTITHKYQVEVNKKYSSYEQSINGLQKQNQQLKRYVKELGGKYQGQLKGLGQNFTLIQRENQQLKRAIQQISVRYETQIKKTSNIQVNLSGLGQQNSQLKRRLTQLQQQFQGLVRKFNQIQQQNDIIKRQSKQNEIQITQRYQSETNQQINIYKQQIVQIQTQWKNLQRENEELQRRLNDVGGDANRKITKYEEELKKMVSQIERLNAGIREYDLKLRELAGQNETLRRQVKETEISITQRWQSEVRNKQANYEQLIQKLTRQIQQKERGIYQNSNKRIMELESKAVLLAQQIQRLNITLKSKNQQNQKMRLQIQRLNNALRIKLQETKQFDVQLQKFRSATQSQFTQLQSSYTVITKQNQNYKKHLADYENSIKKLYVEFQRLQNIINELKKERESLFEKNYALSNQIDRLLSENKDLQVQVQDVRLRLTDESALHKRINEHMGLMVILFAQIESLRQRVKDKQKEVQDVRRSSLAPFKLQSRARGSQI